jgi:hypothetical protein
MQEVNFTIVPICLLQIWQWADSNIQLRVVLRESN